MQSTIHQILSVTASLSLAAATILAAEPETELPAVSGDRIRAHLEFLADDQLEGRGTGSPGYEVAARYVADQFKRLGLKPAGTEGYLQPIEFVTMQRDPARAAVVLHHAHGMTELVRGEDFLERTNPFVEQAQVTTDAVFVGHAVHAPEDGIDNFAGIDLEGKIAVMLSGAPPTLPSEKRAHFSSRATKRQELIARGAVGALTLRTLTDRKRYTWERVMDRAEEPAMVWRHGDEYPPGLSRSFRAHARLSSDGAEKLFAHSPVPLEEVLEAAERGPVDSFAFQDLKITLAVRSEHQVVRSPNVVAVLRGSHPELAAEYVVYTGHLDGLGRGKPVNGDDIYNGFYDNAMGIALMLEVAEVMASAPKRPARSVLFLAVTGEEHGLLGSEYYAHFPTVPAKAMVANVNLDMPLLMYPLGDLNAFGSEHSTLADVAERATRAVGLELSPDPMPEEVLFVRSDQYSFVKQGVPAVYLKPGFNSTDPEVDGAGVTAMFRKLHYHRPSDEVGLPVDWPSVVRFAQVNVLIGLGVANDLERPRWHEGNFFGELFGR